MDIETTDPKHHDEEIQEEDQSGASEGIEIAGGDQVSEEGGEESQAEIERMKKIENDKKSFLKEIVTSKPEEEVETGEVFPL